MPISGSYSGYTPKGNPVTADLHKEFTDHVLESQIAGTTPHPNYDAWYENEKAVGATVKNVYSNPKIKE